MITVNIPGSEDLELNNLVLDYNGTIAADGELITGVADRMDSLSGKLKIYVITADTHGSVREKLAGRPCIIEVLQPGRQDERKRDVVRRLGAKTTVSIGNGRNDALMLKESALGITVCRHEGASIQAMYSADICCTDIHDALDLLLHPLRLIATLRN